MIPFPRSALRGLREFKPWLSLAWNHKTLQRKKRALAPSWGIRSISNRAEKPRAFPTAGRQHTHGNIQAGERTLPSKLAGKQTWSRDGSSTADAQPKQGPGILALGVCLEPQYNCSTTKSQGCSDCSVIRSQLWNWLCPLAGLQHFLCINFLINTCFLFIQIMVETSAIKNANSPNYLPALSLDDPENRTAISYCWLHCWV